MDHGITQNSLNYFMRELEECTPLDREEFNVIHTAWQTSGNINLLTRMTTSFVRYAVDMSRRTHRHYGVTFADAIGMACFGLITGVMKYRPEKGFMPSTYIQWWIRQSIGRESLLTNRLIRLPIHMSETVRGVKSTRRKLEKELCRQPSHDEISAHLGISREKVEMVLFAELQEKTVHIEELWERAGSPDKLDILRDDKQLRDFHKRITKISHRTSRLLETLTDGLDPKEKFIIAKRILYEYLGEQRWTLDKIGRRYDVSRERIRQIEVKLRRMLRERAQTLIRTGKLVVDDG